MTIKFDTRRFVLLGEDQRKAAIALLQNELPVVLKKCSKCDETKSLLEFSRQSNRPSGGLPLGEDYHLDHIMPLDLGGSNTNDNIQLLRSTCNQQKHAKHPVDFMRSRGFLL